jgi:hypothetical protein
MPSALASVLGENTRFFRGYCAHQARSTSSPKAVSAAPSGRGFAAGSMAATPRVITVPGAAGPGVLAHPVATIATATIATPARIPLRMIIGRREPRPRFRVGSTA